MVTISKRLLRSIGMGFIGAGCVLAVSACAPLYGCNGDEIGIGFLAGIITMGAMAVYIKYNPLPTTGGK